jgi:hypothetical protein
MPVASSSIVATGRRFNLYDSGSNTYDQFVTIHYQNQAYGHWGPAFLPWHRWFLKKFEENLRRKLAELNRTRWAYYGWGLPYWDWSVDNSQYSPIWEKGFMGPNGTTADGEVTSGPFASNTGKWPLKVLVYPETKSPYLKRQMGPEPGDPSSLPTPQDVTDTLNETPYDVYPWNSDSQSGFRNMLEGFIPQPTGEYTIPRMHNRVHVWVSGSMIPMTSPNDPVFFLHHCFIDKLWADWQSLHQNEPWYLPQDGSAAPGHNLNDPLRPWNDNTPAGVIDHRRLGYRYDTDDYLMRGEELYPGQWIYSADGQTLLWPDQDGRLYLSGRAGMFWKSEAPNPPRKTGRCVLEEAGNLVLYDPSGGVIWDSKRKAANPNSYLQVKDGWVVIYESDGQTEVWSRPPPSVG